MVRHKQGGQIMRRHGGSEEHPRPATEQIEAAGMAILPSNHTDYIYDPTMPPATCGEAKA